MPEAPEQAAVTAVTDPRLAQLMVHPLRSRVLALARVPRSAAEIGQLIDQPRQKVNYHLGKLAEAGLLELVDERPVRGVTEKLYQATSRAYLLAPDVLGEAGPELADARDAFSAAHLLALTGRTQSELARILAEARAADERVATLSLDATLRLTSPADRAAFTEALQEAIVGLVERFDAGKVPGARPFRLIVSSYPEPPEEDDEDER